MADNFVCNGPISVPLYLKDVKPDVDLGGLKFSYTHGMFYTPAALVESMKPPTETP